MKVRGCRSDKNLAVLFLALGLAGCVGPDEPLDVLLWEGSLATRTGFSTIGGSVAMVANEHDTQIGIGVNGAQPNARLTWAMRTGPCAGAGARVSGASAYPTLTVSAEGEARAETVIRRRVDSTAEYAAEVFGNDGAAVLACAQMQRVQ